jgi:hypothetical protein
MSDLRGKALPVITKIALILGAAACLFASPALSQQPQLDALAGKAAKSIENVSKKNKGVAVAAVFIYQFGSGPTPLSSKLTEDLAAALSSHAQGFTVLSAGAIADTAGKEAVVDAVEKIPGADRCLAEDAGAGIVLIGTVQSAGKGFELSVSAFHVAKGKSFFNQTTDFPSSPDIERLQNEPVSSSKGPARAINRPGVPEAGGNGYTMPRCLYCPSPRYTGRASSMRVNGKAVLDAIIGADGIAHSVTAIRGLPCGLTQQAINSVKDVWRFQPAIGPNSKPASVRMLIVVDFNIF